MGVYIKGLKISSASSESKSSGRGETNFIFFVNSCFLKKKESQRGEDLVFVQNVEISKDMHDMNKESQNSTNGDIFNDIEELNKLRMDSSFIKEQKEEGIIYPNDYNKISDDKNTKKKKFYSRIDYVYNILKESTIDLIINNDNKNENKIIFEKIIHNEGEITFEKFMIPSEEEQKQQFELREYYNLFENYKKLKDFLNKINEISNKFFSENYLRNKYLIQMKLSEDINKNKNANEYIKIINSEYIIFKPFSNKKKFQDKNILNDHNYEGFSKFLKEIINSEQTSSNYTTKPVTTVSHSEKIEINNKKYNFINFIKIIGNHKGKSQKIRELDDGSFVSDGLDGIIKYNNNLEKFSKILFKDYYSFFIDKNEVIISLKNKLTSLSKPDTNISNIPIYPCWNLFKLKNGHYIIFSENRIYYSSDIFNPILSNNEYSILYEKTYRGGIKINDDIIAMTSNRIRTNGENKLIFFDSKSQQILKEIEIENFSFTLSENNCSIMRIPDHENSKLLLAACKKYNKNDKNGILFVILQFNKDKNDIKTYKKFYDTKNFEVYCFCPIFKKENKYFLNEDKAQKIESEYFLVGGFDTVKGEGLIKLYKLKYSDVSEGTEIEYIQNIIIEKKKEEEKKEEKKDLEKFFKGFKGPISCIIQSSIGEILVTCYDGNVYLFSEPSLECLKSCKENYYKDFDIKELKENIL